MEKKTKKTTKKATAPKSVEQIEEIVKEIKAPKNPKRLVAHKMDALKEEMEEVIKLHRQDLGTASCANINKAIADLGRISKNLKR